VRLDGETRESIDRVEEDIYKRTGVSNT